MPHEKGGGHISQARAFSLVSGLQHKVGGGGGLLAQTSIGGYVTFSQATHRHTPPPLERRVLRKPDTNQNTGSDLVASP